MTHVIKVRNVEQALGEGFQWLKVAGKDEDSRAGPVRVAPGPVVTVYQRPWERVLFNEQRDANPVFHLLEAIWMLAGENKVAFLLPYNARMGEYAEDDGHIHGAYGRRWREHWGVDQIHEVIRILKSDPNTRQAVIGMWSPSADLGTTMRDRPCNTHIYFKLNPASSISSSTLDMTVCCRSNDALWGAYGANAVHFSMLQELIARSVGAVEGTYTQFSNNFHAYTDNETVKRWLNLPPEHDGHYAHSTYPMIIGSETYMDFVVDCDTMVRGGDVWRTSFFHRVVAPLKFAYDVRKSKGNWLNAVEYVAPCDWKEAFVQWASRREVTKGGTK